MWDAEREKWFCTIVCSPHSHLIFGLFILSSLIDMYWVAIVISSLNSKAFIGHQLWGQDSRESFSNGSKWPLIRVFSNGLHLHQCPVCRQVLAASMEIPDNLDQVCFPFMHNTLRTSLTPVFTPGSISSPPPGFIHPRIDFPDLATQNVTPGIEENKEREDEEGHYYLPFHRKASKPKSWGKERKA